MNGRESFDDALDAAIDQVCDGRPIADVLAAHPQHAHELQRVLETSQFVASSARATAPPVRDALAGNFTIVRAALERERMAREVTHERRDARPAPWWQRRWSIASLSLPAAVFVAAMFAGATGAAAGAMAVANTDIGENVLAAVTPDWANDVVPSVLHIGDDDSEDGVAPGAADATSESGQGSHPAITITGTIDDPNGNTFTLTSGDDEWKVQFDATTEISGGIVDGANATVTGAETGAQTLHGTEISTDAASDFTDGRRPGPESPANDQNPVDPPRGSDANNGTPPKDPAGKDNGSPPGENSSGGPADLKPTPVASSLGDDEEGATGDNGPPGPVGGPPASPGENANGNSGENSMSSDGNGGGPKEP